MKEVIRLEARHTSMAVEWKLKLNARSQILKFSRPHNVGILRFANNTFFFK
jgi:hypothetical protein